jgi:DNA-binding NarL/FixJ family response regulator
MQIKLLIADDHFMSRNSIKALLRACLDLTIIVINEAESCSQVLKRLKGESHTHLILDLHLADGNALEVLPVIRQLYPDLKIMICSGLSKEVYGKAVKKYGVEHYCQKACREVDTIELFGQFFNDRGQGNRMRKEDGIENPFACLTPRDLEILH